MITTSKTALHQLTAYIVALLIAMLLLPQLALAEPVNVLPTCDGGDTTKVVCQGGAGSETSVYGLLKNIINLLLTIVGIIAVITIIVAGIRYVTSGGDSAQTKSARDTILYAVVGLVIAIMAFAIVNFVLDKI